MEEEPEYRALFAADIEGSAGRGDVALRQIREVLRAALRESFGRSGIEWEECLRDDLGDGVRVTAPAGVRKARLIHPLVHELAVRLRAHNELAGPLARVRVRVALHAGDVRITPDGRAVGRPLEVLARMLDASPARDALARAPGAAVALLVSRHFHEETVCHGSPGIDPAAFREVTFTEKEYTASAWLHVPEYKVLAPGPAGRAPGGGGASGGVRMISRASGNGTVYALGNGTQNIHINGKA
ncbi:hypothetical protein [Streptomyces thermolineatus]|uniref:hypothetical protein n=1 Tax=Streptomyces thermolineatus TaxID=44033 RepID=UPI00384DA42A